MLYHFSEDPTIERFVPHVPRTNAAHPPAVWAIDADHAPLYWFPRDCPRVTVWPRTDDEVIEFRRTFGTDAPRLHAMELQWVERMRTTRLYRYELDTSHFVAWGPASGQWISDHDVVPVGVAPVGDLFDVHVDAGIELRLVPTLWPMYDLAVSDRWDFSIVRIANARPRS